MNREMRADHTPIASNGTQRHANGSSPLPHKNGFSSSTNGHSSPTNDASSVHTNGFSSSVAKQSPLKFYGHDREEVTRLLLQGLQDLGYNSSANRLCQESGYEVESPAVAAFRNAVLQGEWAEVESFLFGATTEPDGGGVRISNGESRHLRGLKFVDTVNPDQMRFIIREQKYLESLEEQDTGRALMVLQTELQPLNWDRGRLNALSELLVCVDREDLMFQAHWDGANGQSRRRLLQELSKSISPSLMIPEHRMAVLLDQAKQSQVSRCLYHTSSTVRSLFTDHMCDRHQFPLRTAVELNQSDGEVWYVEFSHDGRSLATCGEASAVVIYDTTTFEVRHRLSDHGEDVVYVTWSPDDSKIITCSYDHKAKVWDTNSGQCLLTINYHAQPITTAAWVPDGRSFVTGSLDKQTQLCLWDLDEHLLHEWVIDYRIQDCAISPDGQRLVTISSNCRVYVYNFVTREKEYDMDIKTNDVRTKLTCVSISRDSRYMLVSLANWEVRLIDIETAETVRRYLGKQQGEFIIRSAFGGADENLIISGSEDSKVYIWHKENGTLIEELSGHAHPGCVNAVAWNPANPGMFASGGDDRKVRIWAKEPDHVPPRRRVSSQSSSRHSMYGRAPYAASIQ